MAYYGIKRPNGEIIQGAISSLRIVLINKYETMTGKNWVELKKEGFEIVEVEVIIKK